MTRTSIREYTEAIRGRYLRVPRKEKGRILDEFTKVTGYLSHLFQWILEPVRMVGKLGVGYTLGTNHATTCRMLRVSFNLYYLPAFNVRKNPAALVTSLASCFNYLLWSRSFPLLSTTELAHFPEKRHLQRKRRCKSNFGGIRQLLSLSFLLKRFEDLLPSYG